VNHELKACPNRCVLRNASALGTNRVDTTRRASSARAARRLHPLIDRGQGLEFPAEWANKGVPPEQILEALRPPLELPVELVLPTYGAPTDRAALERALS
jgi:hypothetical protein